MMEMLTPDEFYERVGVRVPDSVIQNLEALRDGPIGPRCVAGCHLDRPTGVMWHSPGCPHLEQPDQLGLEGGDGPFDGWARSGYIGPDDGDQGGD